MTSARSVFEAIMRAKGHGDFTLDKGKYTVPSMQVRWNYFQLGWEMAKATA